METPTSPLLPFRPESEESLNTVALKISFQERLSRKVKKNIYRWHRTIGLMTVVPVIFWTLSGLSHPLMSHWFRPTIAREFLRPQPIVKDQLRFSLQQVLQLNGLRSLSNFRIITWERRSYYQIKKVTGEVAYFDTQTGQILPNGDQAYAEYLARYFLDDQQSKVKAIIQVKEFDHQYKSINRLLPVWKVVFDRPDGMEIYVETEQSRLGTFNNGLRQNFIWLFDTFHNWTFLEKIGNEPFRITAMLLLLSIIIYSAVSGLVIYGLFWKKFRQPRSSADRVGILRQYHWQIGIAVAFVTLTFAGSGAYHVLMKYTPDERQRFVHTPTIQTSELAQASLSLPLEWERVGNLSLVKMAKKVYFQVSYLQTDEQMASITYLDAQTSQELPEGNVRYARFLANKFAAMENDHGLTAADCCEPTGAASQASLESANILQTALVTRFSGEYGFVNKRLPVVKVAFDTPQQTTYYVETSTSRLAAKVEDRDRSEGLSFAVLHKYFLLEWAGKDVRDIVTMLSALGVLVVSLFGLALFLKMK